MVSCDQWSRNVLNARIPMKTLSILLLSCAAALAAPDYSTIPNYVSSVTTNAGNVTNVIAGTGLAATYSTNAADNTRSVVLNISQSNQTNVANPVVNGGYWTNKTGISGTLTISGLLSGNAVSGFPGLCITNLITGQFANPTNSIVLGVVTPFVSSIKMYPNDYVIVTNKSS